MFNTFCLYICFSCTQFNTYFTFEEGIFGFHHFTSLFDEFTASSWLLNVHSFIVGVSIIIIIIILSLSLLVFHIRCLADSCCVRYAGASRLFTSTTTNVPLDVRFCFVIYTEFAMRSCSFFLCSISSCILLSRARDTFTFVVSRVVNNRIGFVCSSHYQANFYQCLRSGSQIPLSVKINSVHISHYFRTIARERGNE